MVEDIAGFKISVVVQNAKGLGDSSNKSLYIYIYTYKWFKQAQSLALGNPKPMYSQGLQP